MASPWVPAKVLEASDREYLGAVLPLLDQAQKEIAISLYLIQPDDQANPDHPVNRLLEALLRARQRDVRVRLYLNTKFRVLLKEEVGLGKYFDRLLESGTEVTALLPARRLHDKLIVIDGRYVVEGSTNWSVSALQTNFESASVIDSPQHARKKLERMGQLMLPQVRRKPSPKPPEEDLPLLPVPETVPMPVALFQRDRLPALVRKSSQRFFDLYLILLGQSGAHAGPALELDLETLGRALRLPVEWDRTTIRRQVIKALRKLQDRYHLLQVTFPFGEDAKVTLEHWEGDKIEVPGRLIEVDLLKGQSATDTFLALAEIVLRKEGVDLHSLSRPQLEKRFGVGRRTLTRLPAARSGK
ncbi:MAG: hypothetical protein HYU34_00730 [Candidatus Omnitrophica bacterium]|nr:hypothetical protein [Candidatus Omnitrophota bacterium]